MTEVQPTPSSSSPEYSGWCTNWGAYDVPTLWKMLDQEDTLGTSQHAWAWHDTHRLLAKHIEQLERCHTELAAAWPPESSPAAAAFISYIDDMLASMRQTGAAAQSTRTALEGINNALVTAREQVRPLYKKWQKYQHEEDSSIGIGDWRPFADTPDDWRQQLKKEATLAMLDADASVATNKASMTPPPKYEVRANNMTGDGSEAFGADGNGTSTGGSNAHSGGGRAQPPFIPAPVPVPPPPPSAPSSSVPPPPPGHGGLLTGGVATDAPGITPTPAPPSPAPPIGPALPLLGLIGPRLPLHPSELPVSRAATGPLPQAGSEPARVRGRAALAPGGVIGGEPTASHPAASVMRRVNPVGGVIGEHAAGPVASAGGQPIGAAGQRGAGRRRDESDQHFDPDNPWATEEGVPGVLKPQPEATQHDAGSGVIGIDR